MKMDEETRSYVRSLNADRLEPQEVSWLLDLMVALDPTCGPIPASNHGRKLAASTFVRLMQGTPVEEFSFFPKTWRAGHAR